METINTIWIHRVLHSNKKLLKHPGNTSSTSAFFHGALLELVPHFLFLDSYINLFSAWEDAILSFLLSLCVLTIYFKSEVPILKVSLFHFLGELEENISGADTVDQRYFGCTRVRNVWRYFDLCYIPEGCEWCFFYSECIKLQGSIPIPSAAIIRGILFGLLQFFLSYVHCQV